MTYLVIYNTGEVSRRESAFVALYDRRMEHHQLCQSQQQAMEIADDLMRHNASKRAVEQRPISTVVLPEDHEAISKKGNYYIVDPSKIPEHVWEC